MVYVLNFERRLQKLYILYSKNASSSLSENLDCRTISDVDGLAKILLLAYPALTQIFSYPKTFIAALSLHKVVIGLALYSLAERLKRTE